MKMHLKTKVIIMMICTGFFISWYVCTNDVALRADYVGTISTFAVASKYTSLDGRYEYQFNENKESVIITHYNVAKQDKELKLPSEIDGYPVTGFTGQAFGSVIVSERPIFEKVIVPGNYKVIPSFNRCDYLKEIVFQEGVEEIRESAFSECNSLKRVVLPETVLSIQNAFMNCSQLKDINLPSSLKGRVCLEGTKIRELDIPKGVTSITLENCSELRKVILHEGLKRIEPYGFSSNQKLRKIIIPNTVVEIGEAAFGRCSSLQTIKLPNNITKLDESVFSGCCSLKKIVLPSGVKQISAYAFSRNKALKQLDLSSVRKIYAWSYSGCTSLSRVKLRNLKLLGNNAFNGCSSLTEVVIPGTVRECHEKENTEGQQWNIGSSADIGNRTFFKCSSLKTVKIQTGVKSIGKEAFAKCNSLREITIPQTVNKIKSRAIPQNDGRTLIKGTVGSYAEKYAKKKGYKFQRIA